MNTLVAPPIVSTNNFSYKRRYFTAWASDGDLHELFRHGPPPVMELQNPKTSGKKVFYYTECVRDGEGDIVSWRYVTYTNPVMHIEVFND